MTRVCARRLALSSSRGPWSEPSVERVLEFAPFIPGPLADRRGGRGRARPLECLARLAAHYYSAGLDLT